MENIEIARILNDYADLLEIKGGNPFRIRSYRRAAQMIQSYSQRLAQLLGEGRDLTQLPGIGASMAAHIKEIVATGTLQALQELRKEFPTSMAELLELEGLGPKRTRQLHEALGVRSIAELEKAIESGKVAKLPGFGEKSVEKIRQALERAAKRPKRFKLSDADQLVRPFIDYLRKPGDVSWLEVAGSYRRRMETVGDIDILAVCSRPKPVMERFQSYPEVERVLGAGNTRGTVVLRSGLQVDLRIVPEISYGAALSYFTGSKTHNIAVRTLGVERGLRINEYGIFRVPKGKKAEGLGPEEGRRMGGSKEEDVFRAVGLDWVPPELREDRGEIEAAAKHKLPDLIALEDIRGDLHMHSRWTDGRNTIEEMLRACQDRDYQYCAMTDHSQAVRVAGGLGAKDFTKQLAEIRKVRGNVRGISLLAGCEVDILPDGKLDLPDDILEQLDIVVASVHSKMDMTTGQMTQRVIKALAHPAVNILGHPTGRQISHREPFAIDLEEVFHAAKEYGVAVELNAQPERLDLNDVHVHRAREIGVKIAISSDAHSVEQLRFMSYGIDQGRRGWLENKDVINTLTWPQFEKWLKKHRRATTQPAAH